MSLSIPNLVKDLREVYCKENREYKQRNVTSVQDDTEGWVKGSPPPPPKKKKFKKKGGGTMCSCKFVISFSIPLMLPTVCFVLICMLFYVVFPHTICLT